MRHTGNKIFYHRTNADNARAIIESGFKNISGYFMSNRIWTGVWLSSIPVECVAGDTLLMVKMDIDQRELTHWEWASEGRSYREWLIPAGIVNRGATVEPVEQLAFAAVAA